jgi:hypothetical protein
MDNGPAVGRSILRRSARDVQYVAKFDKSNVPTRFFSELADFSTTANVRRCSTR